MEAHLIGSGGIRGRPPTRQDKTETESSGLPETVEPSRMQAVYEEISTPYKFGLVLIPPDPSKKVDCPSVFRKDDRWYMTYLVYDGRGYETWLRSR